MSTQNNTLKASIGFSHQDKERRFLLLPSRQINQDHDIYLIRSTTSKMLTFTG